MLSSTGAPWLHQHYPVSSLLWAPPTSNNGFSSSQFRLVRDHLFLRVSCWISWVTTHSHSPSRHGLRPRSGHWHSPHVLVGSSTFLCTRSATLIAPVAVACELLETLGLSRFSHISGLNTFTVSITRYHCTSMGFVPTHQAIDYSYYLQGSISGGRLALTRVGFPPTRMCSIAQPQPSKVTGLHCPE